MKNQEKHLETQQKIDKKRRFIGKAGLVTPVIATLAGRPVFGAQCLSQQLSGNMSQTGPGSCAFGKPINFWANPTTESTTQGTKQNQRTPYFFVGTKGYEYGRLHQKYNLASYCDSTDNPEPWTDGAEYSGTPMRVILCDGSSDNAHIVAAYLNAQYITDYILTEAQIDGLVLGTIPVPSGLTLTEFLASTFE